MDARLPKMSLVAQFDDLMRECARDDDITIGKSVLVDGGYKKKQIE